MFDKYVRYSLYFAAVLICFTAAGLWAWKHFTGPPAVIMQSADLQNVERLQKELDLSKREAQELKAEIAKVSARPPVVNYTVKAETVSEAAKIVSKQINDNSIPVALPKAEKTIVTPNIEEQKVDVYRITLDKPRGVGAYVSSESAGAMMQYKNVVVFGGPKYRGGYEVGAAYMIRW